MRHAEGLALHTALPESTEEEGADRLLSAAYLDAVRAWCSIESVCV